MGTNEELTEVLKTQDLQKLSVMIENGIELQNINLVHVLVDILYSQDAVNSRFIKTLIENGVIIENATSKKQTTPFMLLAYSGVTELVELFIQKGIDINQKNIYGMNALHWALAGGNISMVELLLEHGGDIYAKAKFEIEEHIFKKELKIKEIEVSSFAFAFNTYNPQIIKLLLNKGFNVNEDVLQDKRFFSLFDGKKYLESSVARACKNNDTQFLKLLVEKGANRFDTEDLRQACEHLNFEMVQILVENGTIVNKKSNKNNQGFWYRDNLSPLSIVCQNSAVEPINGNCASSLDIKSEEVFNIIKYLIENGADVNIDSPLMVACSFEYGYRKKTGHENQFYADINLDIIKLLLEKGADVNDTDESGDSVLMEAINRINGFELAKLLIDNGANVNHKNKSGDNCLFLLQNGPNDEEEEESNAEKTLKLLIDNDANINEKNNMGMTPLMKYSFENNERLVKILLDRGADINIKSEMTAFDLTTNESIKESIKKFQNNYPQKLVKLLSNFTVDKPIKYTTHDWDFGSLKVSEYKSFDGYMEAVRNQFETIKHELQELSPNLYKKIYTFLMETNPEENYSWCHKTPVNIGWSSLQGLREHCDNGSKPESFRLVNPIFYNGHDLSTFKEVIELFKQEIEIRENFRNLETLFSSQKNKLGYGRNANFNLDLNGAKLARQFYTDVEKFSNVLDKIFAEIKTRKEYPNIEVITTELEDRSIEIKIMQIGSTSRSDAANLLAEVQDGDFADIQENLKNLCDWSIESSFEEENFRVNFLRSNNVKEIQNLQDRPKGFTHILRFYR